MQVLTQTKREQKAELTQTKREQKAELTQTKKPHNNP
jgi:hypothetical protein